jgi:hypothetical protein
MSWLFGALGIGVLFIIWFVAGLAGKSARLRQTEQELDEWEGVLDVKREARDKLKSDSDYVDKVEGRFND